MSIKKDFGLLPVFLPVVWKQGIEPGVRVGSERLNYVVEIFGWIYLVSLTGGYEGKEHFCGRSAFITAQEVPILATASNALHFLFRQIVMCALPRCTGSVGTMSHPATLAPAGSTQGESGGDK